MKSHFVFSHLPVASKRALALSVWILLLAPASLGGSARAQTAPSAQELYALIQDDQALHTASEFVAIEDFSAASDISDEAYRTWEWSRPSPQSMIVSLDENDGRNRSRGRSLKAKVRLNKNQSVRLIKKLDALDVSRAENFLLKIKTDMLSFEQTAECRLLLKDYRGSVYERDITPQIEGETWNAAAVQLNPKKIDLDQLSQIEIRIKAKRKAEGSIWFDELTFQGGKDLNFKSSVDNIRGFPAVVYSTERRKALALERDDRKFLMEIARDTWGYFANAVDLKTALVVDNIKAGDGSLVSGYTSPTNIGVHLMSIVSARELKLIERGKAEKQIQTILSALAQMKKHKGFYYNFYETKNYKVTRPYLSSVDNGWLGVALVVVRQAFPKLSSQASQILDEMNFDLFLDPETNQLQIGFELNGKKDENAHHYGMLVSEARATSLLAIGKGDVPESHWWFLYRTPPEAWRWQTHTPHGEYVSVDGNEYFQGYYTYRGKKFVPSWGGSLFEFLMPTLVLNEKELAPKGLGANNRITTQLHIEYALQQKEYPLWGISPASVENGRTWRYREFGIKELGVKGYPDQAIVTPHVSFLALDVLSAESIKNIRKYLDYETYGPYGLYDSLNLKTLKVNTQYLALDQGMSLIAMANYLTNGVVKKYFHQDPVGKKTEKLLMKESFFKE